MSSGFGAVEPYFMTAETDGVNLARIADFIGSWVVVIADTASVTYMSQDWRTRKDVHIYDRLLGVYSHDTGHILNFESGMRLTFLRQSTGEVRLLNS